MSLLSSQVTNGDLAGKEQGRFGLAHTYTGRSMWCKLGVWEKKTQNKQNIADTVLVPLFFSRGRALVTQEQADV